MKKTTEKTSQAAMELSESIADASTGSGAQQVFYALEYIWENGIQRFCYETNRNKLMDKVVETQNAQATEQAIKAYVKFERALEDVVSDARMNEYAALYA